mgnify:CR=1 FL=1
MPRAIGIAKDGTIPRSVVQSSSERMLAHASVDEGTRLGGAVRIGESTNRAKTPGRGRCDGTVPFANTAALRGWMAITAD